MKNRFLIELILGVFMVAFPGAEALAKDADKTESRLNAETFRGLALRNIGPALKSGRIADLVIHPADESVWYAAVASGGIWKSVNAGTTWTPVFDDQASYSIGCLATDPGNPNVIWAGTGEDVGTRHVAFGDGIYRTDDGGKTWQNMGLRNSEPIARIIVSAEESDVVYVAVQGALRRQCGDWGVFKTTQGGKSLMKTQCYTSQT